MPKQNETRRYPMADANLKQEADDLKDSLIRDLPQFKTRNVTQTDADLLGMLTQNFDETSTDEEMQGMCMDAVLKRDALAEQIKLAIRPIRNMADITFGGVGKYRIFGFESMGDLSGNDLYRMAKRVVRVGSSLLAEIAPQGLSAEQLTALDNLAISFDKSIDAVNAANENRDLEAQHRIQTGNLLWAKMTLLASIGQSLFADTDPARYNDYVLSPSSSTPAAVTPNPPTA